MILGSWVQPPHWGEEFTWINKCTALKTLEINQDGTLNGIQRTYRKEEKSNRGRKEETKDTMADLSSNISVIALNVSGLNTPIIRQRLADWKNG